MADFNFRNSFYVLLTVHLSSVLVNNQLDAQFFSVARVLPKTSKGITDLLLINLVRLEAACRSRIVHQVGYLQDFRNLHFRYVFYIYPKAIYIYYIYIYIYIYIHTYT